MISTGKFFCSDVSFLPSAFLPGHGGERACRLVWLSTPLSARFKSGDINFQEGSKWQHNFCMVCVRIIFTIRDYLRFIL